MNGLSYTFQQDEFIPIEGVLGGIFLFFSNFNRALFELILKALIRRRIFCGTFDQGLQSLSMPRKKKQGLYGLNSTANRY